MTAGKTANKKSEKEQPMTQPEQAVGGSNDAPVVAADEPTIEDRLNAATGETEDEELNEDSDDEAPAETELTEDDVTDEAEADEAPPINAPVSWDDEAKAIFATLPRDAQEIVQKREAERDKFVQAKAQEAKSAHVEAEKQALIVIQRVQEQNAAALTALQVPLPPKPNYQLQADDPWAYAEQMQAFDQAAAHNQWIEQSVAQARGMAEHAEQDMRRISDKETEAYLREHFPEYLDPATGSELRTKLGSTALELGYSEEQLSEVDGRDIRAMRLATEWREKAAKYDKLISQKMEKVRGAKLPAVSKPGTSSAPGAQQNIRYAADRKAMRNGDKDAAVRALSRFL